MEGEEKERLVHCLRMRLIATEFHGDCVRTCTYGYWWRHKLAVLICQFMCSWCSVQESFILLCLCLLLAGHLEIKLKKEQVASNECAYQGNKPLCGYPPISVSPFVPQPTRHFSFLLDSIKVARACSNNVYNVPSTKAEIILWWFTAIHVNHWSSY